MVWSKRFIVSIYQMDPMDHGKPNFMGQKTLVQKLSGGI